jgi:metallo-beta-lactamase family protein
MVVISASGMCEAGRILHHLRNNIENPVNTILVVGYMAQHTLGKKIVERQPVVKIFGEEHNLRAEVVKINAFSAHADKEELHTFIRQCNSKQCGSLERSDLPARHEGRSGGKYIGDKSLINLIINAK